MSNERNEIDRLKNELAVLLAQREETATLQGEKDRLEKENQIEQNRFKIIFEKSVVGKKLIDDQLNIIKVNKAFLETIGYSESEMLGRRITDFSHPDFVEHWKKLQHELWTAQIPSFSFESCLIKKNGDTVWVQITSIRIEDDGEMLGYTVLQDISERKELEKLQKKIKDSEHRKLIVGAILSTQEERARIAESLHNGLGQVLFAVKLSLPHLKVNPDNTQPGNIDALRYTEQLVANCIDECKRISRDLTPAMLEKHGLKKTVADICRQLTDSTVFSCHINGFSKRLAPFLEVAIYRIIQELAMNIVNHAKATKASISIEENERGLQLRVWDNGKGFSEADPKSKGIGLQMIRHKVTLLGGSLNISSARDKGTTVDINIPKGHSYPGV